MQPIRIRLFTVLFASSLILAPLKAQDIVDVAIGAGSFNTLVAAVQAAGLEDALRGDGPFTVFAPTDAAFAALPDGAVDDLLANPDQLAEVLLYHVVAGQVLAADVVQLTSAETLQGESVSIAVENGGVKVNDANVLATDVLASNGVIHVIDSVLIPPQPQEGTIVDVAVGAGSFNTLVAAVQAAGLEDALRSDGPFTVFAPTDDAFAALPAGTIDSLLANPDQLAEILLYHVVAGEVLAADVVQLTSAETLQGESVSIAVENGGVKVNDANVLATDVLASNGVIHVIDAVLIPPQPQEPTIVDVAASAGRFNTLLAAAQAAGLADALASGGPFTVFAPNDEAFAKIPSDVLNSLLNDPEALANILLYHVLPGEFDAEAVLSRRQLKTLQGSFSKVSVNANGAFIDDAEILNIDIIAANGIIHEIDTVIIPPENPGTLYEVTVTNATKRQTFSPPIVATHSTGIRLFQLTGGASPGLQLMAEDGDNSLLRSEIEFNEAVYQVAAFDQPLLPGETRTLEIRAATGFTQLSVAGMLVVTNDSFFAVQAETPSPLDSIFKNGRERRGEVTVHAIAYDAGTEYNSESCDHIPGGPCGSPGSSPDEPGEGYIYVSNGISGKADLSASDYDWRNPVAIITIKRK